MINVREIVGENVNEIWQEYSNEYFCQIPPLSVSEIPQNGIIFLGINPSLAYHDRERLLKENRRNIEYYTLKKEGENNHKYFRKFSKIAAKIDLPWGHLDLLYIRETQQKKLKEILNTDKGIDFIYKQVIDKLIEQSNPIIFVVNNTLAIKFLGKERKIIEKREEEIWMGYEFEWKEDFGTYFIENHPFFFTSMLTGQRALDYGSYERLIWHIKFVKEKLKIRHERTTLYKSH